MGNISSLNFQKTQISKSGYCFQLHHNSVIRPNYAIGGELICNHNADEAQIMRDEIIKNAKATYQKECKARNKNFQAKSYLWSAVVNIKDTTTMADLKKLTAHFKDKYGFQCYQIAIHRDEGHIDELGNKRINHHAHLEFVTLDERTGKNQWKNINKTALSRIQDEVAQILQMERGEYAEITGAKHLSGRAYGAMKQREKAERKAVEQQYNQKLNAEIEKLKKEYDEKLKKAKQGYNTDRESFKSSGNATQQDYSDLKQEFEIKTDKIKAEYEQKIVELEQKIKLNADIEDLEKKKRQLEDDIGIQQKFESNRDQIMARITELGTKESKNTQNRAGADTKATAPVQPKSTETTQSVETTQKTEPKIDAPVKEKQQEPQAPQTATPDGIEAKTRLIDEAIAKTNQKDNQTEFLKPNMPKSDFNDDTQPNYHKKR